MEGKIQKMKKKFSKNFIVPNCSLGHTDHLYTYKRYVEHVGFTEKLQKTTILFFFAFSTHILFQASEKGIFKN